MRTFDVKNATGGLRAFEIEHVYLSNRSLKDIVSSIPGAAQVKAPGRRERTKGVRLEFQYQGVDFTVWEPHGDSSRYWIGPKDDKSPEGMTRTAEVRRVFDEYRPPRLRTLIGNVVSLNLRDLLRRG